MESEDSRDASTDNESLDKTPDSVKSTRSLSRSISRSPSPNDDQLPLSRQSKHSPGRNSGASRSSSPGNGPGSPSTHSEKSISRPHTPKSVGSDSSPCRNQSPDSPLAHIHSPVGQSNPKSPEGDLRPSSSISSRSSSPESTHANKSFGSNQCDRNSIKSSSSHSSRKSKSVSLDRSSGRSSKNSLHGRKSEDGNSSDSSSSSVDSSCRKNISNNVDVQPEEISDGDIESDEEALNNAVEKRNDGKISREITMSHEDLSDVSDLDESIGSKVSENGNEDKNEESTIHNDEQRIHDIDVKKFADKATRSDDGEEQLDFEAEDGECGEIEDQKEKEDNDKISTQLLVPEDGEAEEGEDDTKDEEKQKEDLEEGEVTDEDDARPEETEPRPVCRFFSRGQCTWGASCRFLHPGVTDKGNYTMFEMIRPVVPGEFDRSERMFGRVDPPQIESAWERGLRTAKEMLRKSIKRKEQDIDFEEKKMNLSLAQEEFDKENGYYGRVPSPEPRYVRHTPVEFPVARPPAEEYYNRRQVVYEPDFVPRERVKSYRELPTHKMPDYYNNKYEEEQAAAAKLARKPKREVIVQRVEREERPARADEWSDPWMRSKSPVGRKSGRKRSYSSASSYSSSSSTHTSSSSRSYRSRSRSANPRRAQSGRGRHVSPSVIVSERKAANERAAMMNPPAPRKRAPSPGMLRAGAANPPAPPKEDQFGRTRSKLAVAAAIARARGQRRSSRSSSDSSGTSSSDSDSSGSSSSSSRDGSSPPRRTGGVDISIAKAMDALKGNSSEKRQIKLNLKTPLGGRKPELSELVRKVDQNQMKKRPASSPPANDPKSKKATSRREELLKQLKAVEDAIAKKRSKVN